MNWATLKRQLGLEGRTHAGRFVAPSFAVLLEPGIVAAARLDTSKRLVRGVRARALPAGALAPSANKTNLTDGAAIRRAIEEVGAGLGSTSGKLGLLIPDVAARVALLPFETLPSDRYEAESLVLWRMREFLPYPPEEARLTFQVMPKQAGVDVLGIAVRGSVLAEYEAALAGINGGPALILPATVALLPLLPEEEGGQLLLHLSPGALTVVVVAFNCVRYWRTRALQGEAADNLDEVVREATRVLATCQDNLGVQVQNIWLCARPAAGAGVKESLAEALHGELRPLPAGFVPPGGLPSDQRVAFEQFGMPFAGLLANLAERR